MANTNITTGSRVTANGGKLATVVSIKGRWVKVQFDHDGSEKNVGFKDVTLYTETVVSKVRKEKELKKIERKLARVSTKTPGVVCPECGSEEVYHGRNVKGIVQDEDTIWGCHSCGWDNLAKNGVVDPAARARYTKTKIGDIVCLDNGDEVAKALRGMDLDDVIKAAADVLDVVPAELRAKYSHLNNGQIRMNLGNRIRKAVKNDPALMAYVR